MKDVAIDLVQTRSRKFAILIIINEAEFLASSRITAFILLLGCTNPYYTAAGLYMLLTCSTQNSRLPIQSSDRERTPPFGRVEGEKSGLVLGLVPSWCWYNTVPDTQ